MITTSHEPKASSSEKKYPRDHHDPSTQDILNKKETDMRDRHKKPKNVTTNQSSYHPKMQELK